MGDCFAFCTWAMAGNIVIDLFFGVLYVIYYEDFYEFDAQSLFKLFRSVGFCAYISAVIWARLLRTREFYADWRAAIWGSQNGLNEILHEETENGKTQNSL